VGGAGYTISTQSAAQNALVGIENAIVSKDKIRANLGALQNRLENTITNLQIQSENLQAAESRISDVDVSQEMTEFTRQQILTQSAVAMLSQANSLPRMAMQLLGG
jgi:flagellin